MVISTTPEQISIFVGQGYEDSLHVEWLSLRIPGHPLKTCFAAGYTVSYAFVGVWILFGKAYGDHAGPTGVETG